VTTGAGCQSKFTARSRVAAISRALRVCGICTHGDKRSEQNRSQAPMCSHVAPIHPPTNSGLDLAQALSPGSSSWPHSSGPSNIGLRSAPQLIEWRQWVVHVGSAMPRLSAASPHSTNMTYANYPARLRPKGGVTIAVDCNTTTETLAISRLSSQSVSQLIPIRRRAHIPSAQFR
jgi:hypothetical protein